MKENVFLKGIAGVSIASGKTYSSDELEVLFGLLQDIPDDTYLQACHNICNGEEQFFKGTNVVAMIRTKAEKISNPRISGAEAWEQVIAVADSKMRQKDLDQIAGRTFKSLGFEWHTLVTGGGFALTADKIGHMRRDFLKFFDQFSEGEQEPRQERIDSGSILESVGDSLKK